MKKKIFLALFTLVMALALCTAISADDITDWTLSEDGKTLIVGDEAYELYEGYLYPYAAFNPQTAFRYENNLGYTYYLKRNNEYNGIMVVSYYSGYTTSSSDRFYVNDEGRAYLDSFIDKNFSSYKLHYSGMLASTPASWINSLDGGTIVEIDVRQLEHVSRFDVFGYDQSETFAHKVGAIYADMENYYYVNYDKLPNNYFDANGNFSYRQGTVKAYKLSITQASEMNEYIDSMQDTDIVYEGDTLDGLGRGFSTVYFVIITAIFGFILPLAPVVIGTFRIITGKSKNPRRWYLLFISCGLWVISFVGILLTLIF